MKNSKLKIQKFLSAIFIFNFAFSISAKAQETPPPPSAPRSAKIPAIVEKKLPTGLTVATVERKNVPLVTVRLLVKAGASSEQREEAGLANLTASMLTKGTKTRSASQIAEQVEFLGGSINSGAGWNNSVVTITVMGDKLDAAMAILADVVLNPAFKQEELDLLKSQTLDDLTTNLKQPGFLATYVGSLYSYDEHPAGGTPESIAKITRDDILNFKKEAYNTENSVLIFTGDVTSLRANALAQKYFGRWKTPAVVEKIATMEEPTEAQAGFGDGGNTNAKTPLARRILVVDLPDSGQAAVNYNLAIAKGRTVYDAKNNVVSNSIFYPALVLNSVLGGGYSSRLNQEIRIRRGLSYGAGSVFNWRAEQTNFGTRTQTKNESAAEVAEVVLAEIEKMIDGSVAETELAPRKLVLTGDFGRDLETTNGLAETVSSIYTFELPLSELTSHIRSVNAVSGAQVKSFATENLKNGDLVIVGDYKIFKDDLAKRFPNMKIDVVKAEELDLSKENLRK
jgi:zinc protease